MSTVLRTRPIGGARREWLRTQPLPRASCTCGASRRADSHAPSSESAALVSLTTSLRIRPLFERTVDLNWVRSDGVVYLQRPTSIESAAPVRVRQETPRPAPPGVRRRAS